MMPKLSQPKTAKPSNSKPKQKPSGDLSASEESKPSRVKKENTRAPLKDSSPMKEKLKKETETKKREVVYEKPSLKLYANGNPLTGAIVKKLLGYAEPPKGVKDGLFPVGGKKVWLTNNDTNRPFYQSNADYLTQEILRGNWEFNGEPMIIGETGRLIDGQHTGIALLNAIAEWAAHPGKWKDYWETEPVIDKLVVFGVKETDKVVNTVNTGRPRTLTDVLYRSKVFSNVKEKDRRKVSSIADWAVRLLWARTGANRNAYTPRRTHRESLFFIERHPKLVEAVRHIWEENGSENRIGRYISPGYAAGLLYLMASMKSSRAEYLKTENPNEESLDLSMWDRACEFFVFLASTHDSLKAVIPALAKCSEGTPTRDERQAVVLKAWLLYAEDKPVTVSSLALRYQPDSDGLLKLAEHPVIGGIDVGDTTQEEEDETEEA